MAQRLSPHMHVMQAAAKKAGRQLLRDFNEVEQLQVAVKAPSDFVSQADLRAEATLREELSKARPGYAFLMEESGASGGDNWAWRWVVDPLDGTTNFLHGIPHWAISIGLEKRLPDGESEVHAALIYNPASDDMYWAEKGASAWVNDRRLRVAARRDLKDSVLATGIPFAAVAPAHRLAFARTLGQLMPVVAGIRRFGAAALDLAWVAAGRFDGFWELGLKPWDMSAGLLLVREAGGYVTEPDGTGDPRRSGNVVAANPLLHPRLCEIVADGQRTAAAAMSPAAASPASTSPTAASIEPGAADA
jgi:myo-inositol-1(or 4)-monophosphatase